MDRATSSQRRLHKPPIGRLETRELSGFVWQLRRMDCPHRTPSCVNSKSNFPSVQYRAAEKEVRHVGARRMHEQRFR